jgi:sulfur carrier protein
MITIKINGQDKIIKDNTTISDFLKENNIEPIEITIEHNFEIVKSENIRKIALKDGDTLEILRFIGGG